MEAYPYLRRRRGRAGHGPEIPSSVRCLGRDAYPRGPVVGTVINIDSVAAGVLSAPVDVLVLADGPNFSTIRRDVLRDPEPVSSTVATVLDYQAVAVG